MATSPVLQPDRIYSFGPFTLSACDAELRKNGIRIKLQEQPYQLLTELVANAGRVVTREELQHRLWPADTFVDFDVGLNSAVRKLRQCLGDDADRPRYIETISKRGYRFIAPVKEQYEGVGADAPQLAPPLVPGEPDPSPIHPAAAKVRSNRAGRYGFDVIGALIFAALAFVALHTSSSSIPRLLSEQRITSNPEEAPITGAVISPDGRYLAYADPTGVYFREIDTGETHALAIPNGADWVPTSWYPDNTHLLLSSRHFLGGPERYAPNARTDIWRTSILGGPPQKIAEAANAGVVSPDGSHIAFLRGGGGYEPRQIWVADTGGENPKQLLVSGPSEDVLSELSWSANGNRLAYVHVHRETPEIWALETLDVKTHATTTLKVSRRLAAAVCWGPDGRLFYGYHPDRVGERAVYDVFSVRVNEKTGAKEGQEQQLTEAGGVIGSMSISANGKRLVVWRDNQAASSFVAEIDPATQLLQPPRRLTLDQNWNFVTAWTPDSRAILFTSNRSGAFKLYRQQIDQVVPELLVDAERVGISRMAPDGKHILFIVEDDDTHSHRSSVLQVPLEGGSSRVVLQDPVLADVQCPRIPGSPCFYVTSGFSPDIYTFDPDSGTKQQLSLPPQDHATEWSLSPDGTTIVQLIPNATLVFTDVAQKRAHAVQVAGTSSLIAVDWAPDSKSVYSFSRKLDGGYALLRIQPDGTTRFVLDSGKLPRYQWAIPAPDGRHIALHAITGETNAWMVEHF